MWGDSENITPQLRPRLQQSLRGGQKVCRRLVAPAAVDPYNSTPCSGSTGAIARWNISRDAGRHRRSTPSSSTYTGPFRERHPTSLTSFADFMTDHYFDFQNYRQFMERIPR